VAKQLEVIEMFPAGDPNLKSHEQCVYREARIMVFEDYESLTCSKHPVIFKGKGIGLNQLMLGFKGEPLKVGETKNYCMEECPFSNCQYHGIKC